jgi:hypothetical protein
VIENTLAGALPGDRNRSKQRSQFLKPRVIAHDFGFVELELQVELFSSGAPVGGPQHVTLQALHGIHKFSLQAFRVANSARVATQEWRY